jgi:hypothetical protein
MRALGPGNGHRTPRVGFPRPVEFADSIRNRPGIVTELAYAAIGGKNTLEQLYNHDKWFRLPYSLPLHHHSTTLNLSGGIWGLQLRRRRQNQAREHRHKQILEEFLAKRDRPE